MERAFSFCFAMNLHGPLWLLYRQFLYCLCSHLTSCYEFTYFNCFNNFLPMYSFLSSSSAQSQTAYFLHWIWCMWYQIIIVIIDTTFCNCCRSVQHRNKGRSCELWSRTIKQPLCECRQHQWGDKNLEPRYLLQWRWPFCACQAFHCWLHSTMHHGLAITGSGCGDHTFCFNTGKQDWKRKFW